MRPISQLFFFFFGEVDPSCFIGEVAGSETRACPGRVATPSSSPCSLGNPEMFPRSLEQCSFPLASARSDTGGV